MSKLATISLPALNRAIASVSAELVHSGFWVDEIADVDVMLAALPSIATCGYFDGEICIPRITFTRLSANYFGGRYISLADVLRHEYAHAVAHRFPALIRSRRFREAFGTHHEDEDAWEYDAEHHVSEYAATNASEDFAETFMLFHRHRGRPRGHHGTPSIRAKWRFVKSLGEAIRTGRRRWS